MTEDLSLKGSVELAAISNIVNHSQEAPAATIPTEAVEEPSNPELRAPEVPAGEERNIKIE